MHSARNPQNDRVWHTAERKSEVPAKKLLFKEKHFDDKIMVFAGVSFNGRSRLTFVDQNAKVNAQYYMNRILNRALIDCRIQIGEGFIFLQDGAPSHTANVTQTYLNTNAPGYIRKEQWPLNSPDLNPMDYGIWAALEQKIHNTKIRDIEHLKNVISLAWRQFSQRFIARTIRIFRHRLQLTIEKDGEHIEQYF